MNAVLETDIGRVRSVLEGSTRLNIEEAHVEACLMRRERLLTHVYENKDKNRLMTNVLKVDLIVSVCHFLFLLDI